MCKFIAKLRLLEHGLLVAAQKLNDLQTEARKRKAGEEDEEEDDDTTQESYQDFEKRVNIFVAEHIGRDSTTSRDHYKAGLVFQARKDVIMEFMKATMLKKCHNCTA